MKLGKKPIDRNDSADRNLLECGNSLFFLQVEFERINGKVAVASKKLDTFDKVSAGKTRK